MDDICRVPRCWRLRDGEFDERRGALTSGGRTNELDRSCQAILTVLLENAGTPVSKERLLTAGWPATIVHENSLAKAIGRIREGLGGNGDSLKAVYGVGYKLDAAILAAATSDEASFPIPLRRVGISFTARGLTIGLVVLAASVALIVAGYNLGNPASPKLLGSQSRAEPPVIADAPDAIGKVLWVDDHPQNNIHEKLFFEKHRIAVHPVTNSDDAMKLLAMYDYKVVITDMGRGEDRLAGARLAQQMRAREDRTPVVIYTVRADSRAKQEAQKQLAAESGAQALAVTPEEVRTIILHLFGNPPERSPG